MNEHDRHVRARKEILAGGTPEKRIMVVVEDKEWQKKSWFTFGMKPRWAIFINVKKSKLSFLKQCGNYIMHMKMNN